LTANDGFNAQKPHNTKNV